MERVSRCSYTENTLNLSKYWIILYNINVVIIMKNYDNWFALAEQYLTTSKLIMEQIIANENMWIMISDEPIEMAAYNEATKWSDFNTLTPALFLLEHGIELLLKGLLLWSGNDYEINHNVNEIIETLKKDRRINKDLFCLLDNYVGSSPKRDIIKDFLQINEHIKANRLHIELRYPESSKGKENVFSPFKYGESDSLMEIEEICSDISSILSLSIQSVRKYESCTDY